MNERNTGLAHFYTQLENQMNDACGLLDLPSELVSTIFDHLAEKKDVFTTRLTSKYLARSCLSSFGRRFFRKRGFLITTESLDALNAISAHPELSKHVQHVWFNPDLYTYVTPKCAPKEDSECEDPDCEEWEWKAGSRISHDSRSVEARRQYRAYQDCIRDHDRLLSTSLLESKLIEAFSKLSNLETVGMRRSEAHQPWGWRKLKDDVGEDPRLLGPIPGGPPSSLSGPTCLFIAVTRALAATNVKTTRLYTDAIEFDNIDPARLPYETLLSACQSILYLEVNASRVRIEKCSNPSFMKLSDPSQFGHGLARLLRACQSLRELGLQTVTDPRRLRTPERQRHSPNSPRSWAYLSFQKLTTEIQPWHLTRVKLERIMTSPEPLLQFLSASASCLTSLKMAHTRLLQNPECPRPWKLIFEFLRDKCHSLACIVFYRLMHEHGSVSFSERLIESTVSYEPPNFSYWQPALGGSFAEYSAIAIRVDGREAVKARVEKLVEGHWYQEPTFSYAMDESLWHTDTSDDEE